MTNGGVVTRLPTSSIAGRQARANRLPIALSDDWDYGNNEIQAWGTVSYHPQSPAIGYANPDVVIVRVQADPTGWVGRAIARLSKLSELQDNWDSYGAKSIERNAVLMALNLIRAIHNAHVLEPTIVPLANGGIQFEWHTPQKDLEVSISPNGQASIYFEHAGNPPTTSEGDVSDLLGQIQALVRSLG